MGNRCCMGCGAEPEPEIAGVPALRPAAPEVVYGTPPPAAELEYSNAEGSSAGSASEPSPGEEAFSDGEAGEGLRRCGGAPMLPSGKALPCPTDESAASGPWDEAAAPVVVARPKLRSRLDGKLPPALRHPSARAARLRKASPAVSCDACDGSSAASTTPPGTPTPYRRTRSGVSDGASPHVLRRPAGGGGLDELLAEAMKVVAAANALHDDMEAADGDASSDEALSDPDAAVATYASQPTTTYDATAQSEAETVYFLRRAAYTI